MWLWEGGDSETFSEANEIDQKKGNEVQSMVSNIGMENKKKMVLTMFKKKKK